MKLRSKSLSVVASVVLGLSVGVSLGWGQIGPGSSSPATGAGNVEPPSAAVDGSGNPTATTPTQPSWDQRLRADNGDANGCNSTRFKCIWPIPLNTSGVAVLDKETGLVWERFPDVAGGNASGERGWVDAVNHCFGQTTGVRKGWMLPTINQINSLVSPGRSNPALPLGHPFGNIQSSPGSSGPGPSYWSVTASPDPARDSNVLTIGFQGGGMGDFPKSFNHYAWCVRGPEGGAGD